MSYNIKSTKIQLLHSKYLGMKTRCDNENNKDYKNYGGRGIKCLWKSFEDFKKDMFFFYRKELTLERIDVNGNYCKENCKWATRKEQARNRTNGVFIQYQESRKTLSEWAEYLGLYRSLLQYRLEHGWSVESAFNSKKYKNQYDHQNS